MARRREVLAGDAAGRKIGRWRDYVSGERAYMVFSRVAKSLLAWQVWAGTLRP